MLIELIKLAKLIRFVKRGGVVVLLVVWEVIGLIN